MDYKEYLNKGIEETNKGLFDEALSSLNKALELEENDALAYFSRAIVYHNIGNIESAKSDYSKAIQLKPNMVDAYYNRAHAILSDKENLTDDVFHSVIKDFDKARELDEKFIDAYYYKAVVQKNLKDYKGALHTLEQAIKIDNMAVYAKALKKLLETKYLNNEN